MYLSMWCFVLHLQLEIKNHVFFTPINWDDLYHKRITPPYNPNVVSEWTCLWMCILCVCVCFKSLTLHFIKNLLFFYREVQLTRSTSIQSSPEKWFPVLWVGPQSSPPVRAPAAPSMGSPSWPPRTASCETGWVAHTQERPSHCLRALIWALLYRCNLSPHDLYWTLLVENKMLKGQLYNIIYAFSFFLLWFFFFVLCEQMCWFSPGCEHGGQDLHKCINGCRNEEEEAGGIMVSYCVKAGKGEIQLWNQKSAFL